MAYVVVLFFVPACMTGNNDKANNTTIRSRLELTELFRLGDELAGDTILFGEIGELVAIDGSGRIFVGEQQDPRIYVFTEDGNLLKTIGQEGRGPNEFQRLESIYVGPTDTLYIFDSDLERISAYEPRQMELVYEFTVFEDSLGFPYWLVGTLNTGFLVAYSWPISPIEVLEEPRLHVMRVGWAGKVIDPPIHSLLDAEWIVSLEGENSFVMKTPFGREPVLRMDLLGSLYVGRTESIDITVISPSGIQSKAVTYVLAPIPLTHSEIEHYVKDRSDWYRKVVLSADLPATKPIFETFIVDDLQRIWIKTTSPSIMDTTSQWLILDRESELHGRIILPVNTNLIAVRGGRAYAVNQNMGATLIVYQVREYGN